MLWTLIIICMVLHFNFHVSELMYGADIVLKDANGTAPPRVLGIRTVFYLLPMVYITLILWFQTRFVRAANLVLSGLYGMAHLGHGAMELSKGDDPSQMALLSLTALLAIAHFIASLKWFREYR